jgi:hypothetical protein
MAGAVQRGSGELDPLGVLEGELESERLSEHRGLVSLLQAAHGAPLCSQGF